MESFPVIRLTPSDSRFPHELTQSSVSARQLYVRGSLQSLHTPHRLAVVGTRKMTPYGEHTTSHLVRAATSRGITIISGLALGVDAVAHRTCLDAGGTTIAVLGSGIDDGTIGPRANLGLAHEILRHGGALISEYEPGHPADRWTFPARNRIISGLSAAVLVTEADIKSGALITARHAADQGRDVLAVPGGIFWPRSAGPNMLIQNGAKAVTCLSDILEVFNLRSDDRGPTTKRVVSTPNPLSARIVAILENGPAHPDALTAELELPVSDIMRELTLLEVHGLVVRDGAGQFRIT